jgi:hypothetical protein
MKKLYVMKHNIKKEHKKEGCGWIDCLKIGSTRMKIVMNLRISKKEGLSVFQELRSFNMDFISLIKT